MPSWAICAVMSIGGVFATAFGTRHLIMATFRESFKTSDTNMAYTNIAKVCHQGKGISPGRPTKVSTVPMTASAVRAIRKVLLGIVDQNQWRSLADIMEKTAK